MNAIEPTLAPPGAGLPLPELLIAKYLIFPIRFRTVSPAQAIEEFKGESEKILGLANTISEYSLSERRLVPRLRGLEDSSRYWSVAMAVEHLTIVGDGIREIVSALADGNSQLPESRIQDVKPSPSVDAMNVLARFHAMTERFVETTEAIDVRKDTSARHAHPWFGPLNWRQWLLFAAPHQRIHRMQIEKIILNLN